MNNAQHTPRPWLCRGGFLIQSTFFGQIANVRGAGIPGNDEADANARLIAAAPDFLEDAKASVPELAMITALLQRAYGPIPTPLSQEEATRIILGLAALERKHRAAIAKVTGQAA